MKAAVYKKPNEMAVVEVPQPVAGPGEVVVKVHDCGICGSDLHAVQYGFGMPPDSVMGHEFCGEIVELGPEVGGYAIGDRVTALHISDAVPASSAPPEKGCIARISGGSGWDSFRAPMPST